MTTPKEALELKPCPFCGGPADFECISTDTYTTWSVGCANSQIDCIGFQVLARFNRKCEAAIAWNTRATASLEGDAVERVASGTVSVDILQNERNVSDMLRAQAHSYRARIADLEAKIAIQATTGLVPDEAAIRAAHIEVLRGLEPKMADAVNWKGPEKTKGEHLFHMMSVIENSTDMPIDKIARWTGFIQGVLAARGLLDVAAERDRTRPIFAAAIWSNQAKP